MTPPKQLRSEKEADVEEEEVATEKTHTERKSSETDVDVEMQMANDVLGDGNDSLEIDMETDVKNISGIEELSQACDLTVQKRYVCEYCEREFITKAQLLRHENQHTLGSGCD
jgi:hypothetical protein